VSRRQTKKGKEIPDLEISHVSKAREKGGGSRQIKGPGGERGRRKGYRGERLSLKKKAGEIRQGRGNDKGFPQRRRRSTISTHLLR